jgi:hypothetical protein
MWYESKKSYEGIITTWSKTPFSIVHLCLVITSQAQYCAIYELKKENQMKVILHRIYLSEATHGLLTIDNVPICLTIELPWVGNQHTISCIPEGMYVLRNRYSSRFKEHIELLHVPNRSYILFHPANNAKRELRGCIAPVTELLAIGWGSQSRLAMDKLLNALQKPIAEKQITLTVQIATDQTIVQQIKKGKL